MGTGAVVPPSPTPLWFLPQVRPRDWPDAARPQGPHRHLLLPVVGEGGTLSTPGQAQAGRCCTENRELRMRRAPKDDLGRVWPSGPVSSSRRDGWLLSPPCWGWATSVTSQPPKRTEPVPCLTPRRARVDEVGGAQSSELLQVPGLLGKQVKPRDPEREPPTGDTHAQAYALGDTHRLTRSGHTHRLIHSVAHSHGLTHSAAHTQARPAAGTF